MLSFNNFVKKKLFFFVLYSRIFNPINRLVVDHQWLSYHPLILSSHLYTYLSTIVHQLFVFLCKKVILAKRANGWVWVRVRDWFSLAWLMTLLEFRLIYEIRTTIALLFPKSDYMAKSLRQTMQVNKHFYSLPNFFSVFFFLELISSISS